MSAADELRTKAQQGYYAFLKSPANLREGREEQNAVVSLADALAVVERLEMQLAAAQERDYLCLNHVVGAISESVDCIACFEKDRSIWQERSDLWQEETK